MMGLMVPTSIDAEALLPGTCRKWLYCVSMSGSGMCHTFIWAFLRAAMMWPPMEIYCIVPCSMVEHRR